MNASNPKTDLTRSHEYGEAARNDGARGPRTNAVKPERSEGVSAIARNAAFYGESNVVTTPIASPVAPITTPEPAVVNPLDELAAAVEEFKSRIRAIFDESTILSRKVKEVALVQKQKEREHKEKEREFVQARRAIERIRMAI